MGTFSSSTGDQSVARDGPCEEGQKEEGWGTRLAVVLSGGFAVLPSLSQHCCQHEAHLSPGYLLKRDQYSLVPGLVGPFFFFSGLTILSTSPLPLWLLLVPPPSTFSFHQQGFWLPLFPHPGADALQKKTSHGTSTTLSSCPGTGVHVGSWWGPERSVLGGLEGSWDALILPVAQSFLKAGL